MMAPRARSNCQEGPKGLVIERMVVLGVREAWRGWEEWEAMLRKSWKWRLWGLESWICPVVRMCPALAQGVDDLRRNIRFRCESGAWGCLSLGMCTRAEVCGLMPAVV